MRGVEQKCDWRPIVAVRTDTPACWSEAETSQTCTQGRSTTANSRRSLPGVRWGARSGLNIGQLPVMECADSESAYILNDASPLQTTAAEDTEKRVQSNIPLTGVNLVLAITGPGVIGVPYALREAGFGLGIVLLVLVAAITDYSVLMLVEVGSLTGLTSYQDVMFSVFGKPGFCLLTFLQFTYPFIALVGSNVMIGDTITKLVGRVGGESLAGTVLSNRQFIILLVTLFITLPISLYKNIARLSKWSCLSIGLLAVLAVFFLIRIPEFADSLPTTSETFTFARGNVTQATGIIAYTFMCHHNVFLIHQSLENNTLRRWKIVTHSSFIVSLVIMLVIGVTGYVTFKQEAQGDLLENYCHEDDLINTGRFCLALIVMLSYPIECFATREVLGLSLFANLKDSTSRHVIITVCITALATAVSFSTDCLGIVIELNGVMTACPLTFIIPPLLLIRLRGPPYISWRNVVPALLFLFGVLLGVGGTGIAVINIVLKRRRCNHGYEPSYCLSASMQNLTSGAFSA